MFTRNDTILDESINRLVYKMPENSAQDKESAAMLAVSGGIWTT